ncbi:alpha-L-arabinofuranosidase A [Apodospora peruviana]|uniref:non-reducing end alpha-L-arabinofuranosidase n=1 Tax=Apodospora peruviana TaxID=516989 RepID=A0AAE0IS43_9PEZI|nr:alpha-L-arabinofuranosidase A [Apodospora peruviana]
MFRSFALAVLAAAIMAGVDAVKLRVSETVGAASSPHMYGVMFEDINYSGDGGLYAELIRNRAFQGTTSVSPFTAVGGAKVATVTTTPLSSALPRSMTVTGGSGTVGFSNPGWWGIDIKVQPYTGSFYVRGDYTGTFKASFQSATGEVLGSVEIASASTASGWTQHNFTLIPSKAAGDSKNTFTVTYDAAGVKGGSLNFNLISVFPPTFKNRPNGLRRDLMGALAELNPSLLRFPGGNNMEGQSPPNHWKWQNTIGPLKDRPGRQGTWNYPNTDGLGLVEYMQWCEDLNLEPLLATFAGLYLGKNVIAQNALQPYVDDFMNELEFLMGDTSTKYGALRASLGYPTPWKVNFVEVGNEDDLNNGKDSYNSYRYKMFYNAIKAKYPNMTIIASFETTMSGLPADAAKDYHTYNQPNKMINDFTKFDRYDRAHKVIVGEYANINKDSAKDMWANRPLYPWWRGSVAEAVLAIGAERNGDVVIGLTYAPLFCNLNANQWVPDLIAYNADPSQTVLSTSHAVIKLLSNTRITNLLSTTGSDPPKPLYYAAGINSKTGSRILKAAVYESRAAVPVTVTFTGVTAGTTATLKILTAPNENSNNAVGAASVVQTVAQTLTAAADGSFTYSLPDMSVSVLEVKAAA